MKLSLPTLFTVALIATLAAGARGVEASPAAQPATVTASTGVADSGETMPAPGAEEEKEPEPDFTYGGSADFYYLTNLNDPFTGRNRFRLFDFQDEHGPHLNLIDLWAEYARKPVGFRLDLDWGPAARIQNAGETSDNDLWDHIQQAHVGINLDRSGSTYLNFGKYVTPAGLEVSESVNNVLFGQGILFSQVTPFFHFGFRVFHYFNEDDYVMAHVHRGWDTVVDPDHDPGFGLTYSRTLRPKWTLTTSYLGGDEFDDSGRANWRNLFDLVAEYEAGPRWLYQFNASYVDQQDVKLAPGRKQTVRWYGLMAIAKRTLDEKQYVAGRVDWLKDDSGFILGKDLDIYTLTLNYTRFFGKHFQARLEYRHDFAGGGSPFPEERRGHFTDNQGTITVATIFGL
jgi:putative OmpL-like beta-barrel porin-2